MRKTIFTKTMVTLITTGLVGIAVTGCGTGSASTTSDSSIASISDIADAMKETMSIDEVLEMQHAGAALVADRDTHRTLISTKKRNVEDVVTEQQETTANATETARANGNASTQERQNNQSNQNNRVNTANTGNTGNATNANNVGNTNTGNSNTPAPQNSNNSAPTATNTNTNNNHPTNTTPSNSGNTAGNTTRPSNTTRPNNPAPTPAAHPSDCRCNECGYYKEVEVVDCEEFTVPDKEVCLGCGGLDITGHAQEHFDWHFDTNNMSYQTSWVWGYTQPRLTHMEKVWVSTR